jgi:hypothetical protein
MRHKNYPFLGIGLVVFLSLMSYASPALGNPDGSGDLPVVLRNSDVFNTVDLDQNGEPDHLEFQVLADVKIEGEYWLSAELQSMVGEQWSTINFTAVPVEWKPGTNTGSVYFYGGEFYQRRLSGPYRVVTHIRKGKWEGNAPLVAISKEIPWSVWQESDLAKTGGPVDRASEAVRLAEQWAERERKELGALTQQSFVFDRWRMDFNGTQSQPPCRIWVDPLGDITSVDRRM